jgi:hypothetical protein
MGESLITVLVGREVGHEKLRRLLLRKVTDDILRSNLVSVLVVELKWRPVRIDLRDSASFSVITPEEMELNTVADFELLHSFLLGW